MKKEILLKITKIISTILGFGSFMIIGIYCGRMASRDGAGFGMLIVRLSIAFVVILISFYIQTIIHEAGHLVFGFISKYDFVSFRIGSITIVKSNGKLKLKKMTIAGTGGQCLMKPPQVGKDKYPIKLYLLGGGLFNLISVMISLICYFLLPKNQWVSLILLVFAIIGFVLAVLNLLPMNAGGIANDGYNVFEGKDKNSLPRHSMYLLLNLNAVLSELDKVTDLPEQDKSDIMSFDFSDLTNSSVANLYVYKAALHVAQEEYDLAYNCYERISETKGVMNLFKNEANCELLFFDIINNADISVIEARYNMNLKKYIDTSKVNPSKLRLMYAYYLIIEKDTSKAENELEKLKIAVEKYPVKADANLEWDLAEKAPLLYAKSCEAIC